MEKNILATTVLDCKNLTYNGKPVNDSEVFIRLNISGQDTYYKTVGISNTANPVWNEEIKIPFQDPDEDGILIDDKLVVEVIMSKSGQNISLSTPCFLALDEIEVDSKKKFAAKLNLKKDDQPVGVLNLNLRIEKRKIETPTVPVLLKSKAEAIFDYENEAGLSIIFNFKGHDESESTVIHCTDFTNINEYFFLICNDASKDELFLTIKNGDKTVVNKEAISLEDVEIGRKFTHICYIDPDYEEDVDFNCLEGKIQFSFETFDLESYIRDNQIEAHIKVLKVENLTNFDANSTGSFVKVSVGDEEASTGIKKISNLIEWNEKFDFVSTDFSSDNLVLQLYSKGTKSSVNKRMIDDLSFPLIKFKNIEFCPPTIYTVPMKMRGKDVGQISFEFSSRNPKVKDLLYRRYSCEFTVEANFKNCEKENVHILYGLFNEYEKPPLTIKMNQKKIIKTDKIDDRLAISFIDRETDDDFCDNIFIPLKPLGINVKSEIASDAKLDDEVTGFVKIIIQVSDNEQDKKDSKNGLTEKSVEKSKDSKNGLSEKVVEKSDDDDESNCFIDDEEEKFYVIEKKIGEGATSVAYKVVDKRDGREMCKKVLKIDTNKTTFEDAQNAVKEFEVLRILKHPCICRSIGINPQEEVESNEEVTTIALFLEYCPISLKSLLDNKKLDNTMKTKIAVEIAHAMLFIHNSGMIHRDLKIENIMLTEDNTVKLIDFGLVKIYESLSDDYSFTKESMTKGVGTFYYMSPEMLSEGDYDYKTDVYSYGVVLYYLFLEKLPKITLKDKMSNKEVPLPEPSSSISAECLDIIKKCLRSAPIDRPSFKKILEKMRECSFNLASEVDQESIKKRDKMLIPFDTKKDKKT